MKKSNRGEIMFKRLINLFKPKDDSTKLKRIRIKIINSKFNDFEKIFQEEDLNYLNYTINFNRKIYWDDHPTKWGRQIISDTGPWTCTILKNR